jgi:hypothetical protein
MQTTKKRISQTLLQNDKNETNVGASGSGGPDVGNSRAKTRSPTDINEH